MIDYPDSFVDPEQPKSSAGVWNALQEAKKEFESWWNICDRVDRLVGASAEIGVARTAYFTDREFDLFWASLEIIKPAVYSHPPQPVVAPRFSDRDKVATKASEVLERCIVSSFDRGDFDEVMLDVRDDLIINGRGAVRVYYEDDDGKRVCEEHLDREDFLHEPARKWCEVGWVAFGAYMTEAEFLDRFPKMASGEHGMPEFSKRRSDVEGSRQGTFDKCKVWEVWHKADNRVYWVTEGIDVFLDESKPFIDLDGFYPCPRPAYGTLKRRTLIPVPDYIRYESILEQINSLTRRIYGLLSWIKVKGLIAAGGDIGDAVETALNQSSDDVLLIPVPGAMLAQSGGNFVQFLPLQEFAMAIQGLIDARSQLINDYYQISGISDIMRGYVDAEEKLGQSQLKSQFGSVRVREKIDELQRLARDVGRITAEIIAEKFDEKTILDMAQMVLPTRADIKKDLKHLEKSAKEELEALGEQAQQAMESGQVEDPQQAEQQFNQAQQEIIGKYAQQIQEINDMVSIDDVMDLLRDQKARAFSIEIETDSTILTDEMAEKQSRAEFLSAFTGAIGAIQPLMMAGEAGAKLAGGMMKFALAPFRAGRELDGMVDDFVDAAPQLAEQMQGKGDEAEGMAKLAEAELAKAQAMGQNYEAQAQLKMQELQLKAAEAEEKAKQDEQRFALSVQDSEAKIAETLARIEKIQADIMLAEQRLGLDAHKEQREDIKTAADIEARVVDQSMSAQNQARQASMSERQQEFNERSSDRQMTLAELNAMNGQGRGEG